MPSRRLKRTYQRYKNVSKSQRIIILLCKVRKLKRTYQRYKNVSKSQLVRFPFELDLAEKNLSKIQKCKQITTDVGNFYRGYEAEKNLSKIQKCKQITTAWSCEGFCFR